MKTHCKSSSSKSARAAFTIIELLVAVGVTALMVSLMLTIVVNVLGGWNRSSGTLTSGNQARTVMDLVTGDLQSAILRRDGNVWLVATIQTTASGWTAATTNAKPTTTASSATAADGSLYIPAFPSPITNSPTTLEDYRFGQGGVWLRLFTTVPDTNASTATISAPRAVSYKIVRQNVTASGSESRYMLYRSELPPTTTFTAGYDLFDATYNGVASVIRTPATDSLIANNVIDFGIRLFKSNASNQLIPIFPDTNEVCFAATSTSDPTKLGAGVEATPKKDFPTVAEVSIRVLTDEGATQIANWEAGLISPPSGTTSAEFWWQIALANSRVYTRRIEIKATSL